MNLLIIFLATTLAVSGIAKLVSRDSLLPYLAELGVSKAFARVVTPVISAAELCVALLLYIRVAEEPVYIAAAALAAGFVAVHAVAMAGGVQNGCNCFGAVDRDLPPVASLGRALLLAGAAISLAAWSGASGHGAPAFGGYEVLTGVLASFSYVLAFPLVSGTFYVLNQARGRRESLRRMQEQYSRTG